MMLLVTAPWCNPCSRLKEWVATTGNGEGVEIIDIEADASQVPQGVRMLPTLVVDGTFYVGNENIRPFLSEINSVKVELDIEEDELL